MEFQIHSGFNGVLKQYILLLVLFTCQAVYGYHPCNTQCYEVGTSYCETKFGIAVCHCKAGYTGTFCEQKEMEGHKQDYLTCAGGFFQIKCGVDRTLKIVKAVWGRDDFDQVAWANCKYGNGFCYGVDTTQRLKHLCNHRNSCWDYANTNRLGQLFGCTQYTQPYLKITYVCKTDYTTTICQDQMKYLRCNKGKVIHVVKATYGENKPDAKNACSIIEHNPEHNEVPCMADVTTAIRPLCMGQETCNPTATYPTDIFGDDYVRCNQVPKSLKIEYKCVNQY